MTTSTHILRRSRFLPLFVTQLFNAFNDNLYKTAMVLFVVYSVYNSEADEAMFSAVASGVFILPFFVLSALAGQLADMSDKARIIRMVKACEIGIMAVGGAGLFVAWQDIECAANAGECIAQPHWLVSQSAIPAMLVALFAMGVHSTFFGPIKYAILPQHLKQDEDLTSRHVPPAPPQGEIEPIDFNVFRSSWVLVRNTMHDDRVFLAIMAISFFWTIGAVLFIQFPPLAKNVLTASPEVASLFLVTFSIGVAIGSVSVNALLKGTVSARYSPMSVIVMALFVLAFYFVCRWWVPAPGDSLMTVSQFMAQPLAIPLLLCLLGIAVAGGMFVVPLYAFLTTFVPKTQTARTIAANNIVNSGAMVAGSLLAVGLSALGVAIVDQLLLSAAMCLVSSWLGKKLYAAETAVAQT